MLINPQIKIKDFSIDICTIMWYNSYNLIERKMKPMAIRRLRDIRSAIHDFVNTAIEKVVELAQDQTQLYKSPILNYVEGFDIDTEKKSFNQLLHNSKEVEVPEGIQTVKAGAFMESEKLEEVNLPNSVKNIQQGAFQNCEQLKSVSLPMPEMSFDRYGDSLIAVEGMTRIQEGTFEGCRNLQDINIPCTIQTIEENAFRGCKNLSGISDDISHARNLREIGDNAFRGCEKIIKMEFPDSLTTIGAGAFQDCKNLSDITLPYNLKGIEADTFKGCDSLTSIKIPDRVNYIENNAFKDCSNLESITVSAELNLNLEAFKDCDKLTEINVEANGKTISFHSQGIVVDNGEYRQASIADGNMQDLINSAMETLRNPEIKMESFLADQSIDDFTKVTVAVNCLDNENAKAFVQEHIAEALAYAVENTDRGVLNAIKEDFDYTVEDIKQTRFVEPINEISFNSKEVVQATLWEMQGEATEKEKNMENDNVEVELD